MRGFSIYCSIRKDISVLKEGSLVETTANWNQRFFPYTASISFRLSRTSDELLKQIETELESAVTEGPAWRLGYGTGTDRLTATELRKNGIIARSELKFASVLYLRPTQLQAFFTYVDAIAARIAVLAIPGVEAVYSTVSLSPHGEHSCSKTSH